EPTTELVGELPELVTGPLEPEHRIEDVERDHRFGVRRVRRAGRDQRSHRARLADALVQDLALGGFLVRQEQFSVDGVILLAVWRVDLGRREDRIETER